MKPSPDSDDIFVNPPEIIKSLFFNSSNTTYCVKALTVFPKTEYASVLIYFLSIIIFLGVCMADIT